MPRPAATGNDFTQRLDLALKALNVSRAQLASQVGVDKSMVSRWLSGGMRPTGHNLARISEVLAKVKPGFNILMWERPREEFDAFLGIASAEQPAPPTPEPPPAAEAAAPARALGLRRWLPWVVAGLAAIALAATAAILWPRPEPAGAGDAAAPTAADVSIAVMPFANLSGDATRDFFSDGFTVELLTTLANIPGLAVAPRADAFAFKGKAASTAEIARQLHVRYLLEGSVREDGRRIRVSVELIDADEGRRVWSREYDRSLTDVLSVQDEIARAVAPQLIRNLLPPAHVEPRKIDPQAYRLYLRAQQAGFTGSVQDLERSAALLREAVRLQPDFTDGHAKLAVTYLTISEMDQRKTAYLGLAEAELRRALALDPEQRAALFYMTAVMARQWRWREAVGYGTRLSALDVPEDYKARGMGALYDVFALYDRSAGAMALIARRAPQEAIFRYNLAWTLAATGDHRGALAAADEGLALEPDYLELIGQKCLDLAMLGRLAEARALEARLRARFGDGLMNEDAANCVSAIAVKSGDRAGLRALADRLAGRFPGDGAIGARAIGLYYQQALAFDEAMVWYRRAYERREPTLMRTPYTSAAMLSPEARRLFDDPRWKALWAEPAIQAWVAAREDLKRRR